jgi:hypothetical protein
MTTSGPTTQDTLDDRYGRGRSPGRRAALIIFVVVVAAAVGLFAWMTFSDASNAVTADTTKFTVVDDHSVMLDFQISSPVGRSVACAIEAQDEQHGAVGWRVVEYPASNLHARAFHEVIPTTAKATTGLVNTCWVT